MRCWSRWRSGSGSTCANPTCCRASPATNSCCCSIPIQSQEEVAEYHQVHAAAAEGAVLHRQFGGLRLHLDRRQPLSRTRPQLRDAAPERRHRDVSHQEQRQGSGGLLRCQHGARGAGADEDRAVAAAGDPRKALLLRVPVQGRHPHPGRQGHRGAGAAARRRGRDPGAGHLHQSRRRAGTDRRADPSRAGRDRQVDRPDQRDLRRGNHDQHQRRRQAGRQSRIHAAVRAGAGSDRISRSAS